MTYNIKLGRLATQAAGELALAETNRDPVRYQAFLRKSSEFCKAVRESTPAAVAAESRPEEAANFLSAVVKTFERRSSTSERERFAQMEAVEPLIRRLLEENRNPSEEEQLRIVELLYSASAADLR